MNSSMRFLWLYLVIHISLIGCRPSESNKKVVSPNSEASSPNKKHLPTPGDPDGPKNTPDTQVLMPAKQPDPGNLSSTAEDTKGKSFLLQNEGTSACLTLEKSSKVWGRSLLQDVCWGINSQLFKITTRTDGNDEIMIDKSGNCFDVGSMTEGYPVREWECNKSLSQAWKVEKLADEKFQVKSMKVMGKCLDIGSSQTADVGKARLMDCINNPTQKFNKFTASNVVFPSNTNMLSLKKSGDCLDTGRSSKNSVLLQRACNGKLEQLIQVKDMGNDESTLISISSGLCLSAENATPSEVFVSQKECDASPNQKWKKIAVDANSFSLESVGRRGSCLSMDTSLPPIRAIALLQSCAKSDSQVLQTIVKDAKFVPKNDVAMTLEEACTAKVFVENTTDQANVALLDSLSPESGGSFATLVRNSLNSICRSYYDSASKVAIRQAVVLRIVNDSDGPYASAGWPQHIANSRYLTVYPNVIKKSADKKNNPTWLKAMIVHELGHVYQSDPAVLFDGWFGGPVEAITDANRRIMQVPDPTIGPPSRMTKWSDGSGAFYHFVEGKKPGFLRAYNMSVRTSKSLGDLATHFKEITGRTPEDMLVEYNVGK